MKIVIDARMYGLENAGIGRYVIHLIDQLSRQDQENTYYLLLRKKYFISLQFKNKSFKKILADYGHYSLSEQFKLPYQLWKIRPDLVHFPHFNVPLFWFGPYVVTIHDLIKHSFRGVSSSTKRPVVYWIKYFAYRAVVCFALRRAEKIITPSQFWKDYLIKHFKIAEDKVNVTYEGIDSNWDKFNISSVKRQKILSKYKIIKPYVIYVGSLYPHKNVEKLIEAIKLIKINLVIVCARDVFQIRLKEMIKKQGCQSYVNFVGFVPDEELYILYQESLCLVFPSLMEGFGLPGLEAMKAGTAVLASNSSCLPEIYGKAALYFDPHNIEQIAQRIFEVKDKNVREKLLAKNKEQLFFYSWDKMGTETLSVYREIL